MVVLLNSHLRVLSVAPDSSIRWRTASNRASCCDLSLPYTNTSSMWHTTPSRPVSILLMRFWKYSGALDTPNGILLKQKRPNGVMNVVSRREAGESGICQNPLLASNLLNTLAPVSCASVSSTLGKG